MPDEQHRHRLHRPVRRAGHRRGGRPAGHAADAALVWGAAGTARFLGTRPVWMAVQRWVLGAALALIAVKLATEGSR